MEVKLVNYFKGELMTNWLFLGLGVICVLSSIFVFFLNSEVYRGLSYSLFPIGGYIIYMVYKPLARMARVKKLIRNSESNLKELISKEKELIEHDIATYTKDTTFYSIIFVVSMVLILICFIGARSTSYMGIVIGLCITSVILLCRELVSTFRKKLFLHEIEKYFNS